MRYESEKVRRRWTDDVAWDGSGTRRIVVRGKRGFGGASELILVGERGDFWTVACFLACFGVLCLLPRLPLVPVKRAQHFPLRPSGSLALVPRHASIYGEQRTYERDEAPWHLRPNTRSTLECLAWAWLLTKRSESAKAPHPNAESPQSRCCYLILHRPRSSFLPLSSIHHSRQLIKPTPQYPIHIHIPHTTSTLGLLDFHFSSKTPSKWLEANLEARPAAARTRNRKSCLTYTCPFYFGAWFYVALSYFFWGILRCGDALSNGCEYSLD